MSQKNVYENKTREASRREYEDISLFKNPLITLKTLMIILSEQLMRFINLLISNKIILLIIFVYLVSNFVEGPHTQVIFK
jgi:hypothetical protein